MEYNVYNGVFSLGVTTIETERTQLESKNDLERIRENIFITVNRENSIF